MRLLPLLLLLLPQLLLLLLLLLRLLLLLLLLLLLPWSLLQLQLLGVRRAEKDPAVQ